MSLTKRVTYWYYEFQFLGERHCGSTKQRTRKQADKYLSKLRERLEADAAGITPPPRAVSVPAIHDWAQVYLEDCRERLKRPDQVEIELRVVLRFWGRRPADKTAWPKADEVAPFHDLTLADWIRDPSWLNKFEAWMKARGTGPDQRNHYRTKLSGM